MRKIRIGLKRIKAKVAPRSVRLHRKVVPRKGRRGAKFQKRLELVKEALRVMDIRTVSLEELEDAREIESLKKGNIRKELLDTGNCLVVDIDPSVSISIRQEFAKLSEEAKMVIRTILKTPKKVTSHTGVITKDCIIDFLRKKKWKYPVIWAVLEEITNFVRRF